MKAFTIIFFSLLLSICANNKVVAQYFAPLNLDNVWVWEDSEWGTIERSSLIDTAYTFNNKTYNRILLYDSSNIYNLVRFDNNDSLYYRYRPTYPYNDGDVPYYRLNCVLGDTFSFQIDPFSVFTKEVIEVYETPVFDTTLAVKIIHWSAGGLVEGIEVWTDELGMLYKETGEGGGVEFRLRGCVINGRLYGDTSLTVGVDDEPFTAHNFKLFQNYPNPFNPVTTIRYQIPNDGLVTLKVYDIIGNKVSTLVNEEKPAGLYVVNFDASRLASGLYIYKLQSSDFVSSKKMILLK